MVYAFLIHTCDKNARPLYSQFFTPEGNDRLMQERSAHFVAVVNREFQFRMASRHSDGFKELETLAGTPASSKSTSGISSFTEGIGDIGGMMISSPSTSNSGAFQLPSILRVLSLRNPDGASSPGGAKDGGSGASAKKLDSNSSSNFRGGAEEGITRLPRGPQCASAKILVWRQILGCGYTLVCDPQENLVMASTWISMFVAVLSKHFNNPRVAENLSIFDDSVEDIVSIVKALLPCGKLLFLNGSVVNQLHRQTVADQ